MAKSIYKSIAIAMTIGALAIPQDTIGREPWVVMGIGTSKCSLLIGSLEWKTAENRIADDSFAWVQGWISARNVFYDPAKVERVGGSLSAATLKSMLIDKCKEDPQETIFGAADKLYDYLKSKGM